MTITPYLTFDGTGAEALAFYAEVLDGEIAFTQRFDQMPDQSMVPEGAGSRLAHGRMTYGDGQVLMISDTMGQEPFAGHNGFSLQLSFDDIEDARRIFDTLADEGEVTMPFGPTF